MEAIAGLVDGIVAQASTVKFRECWKPTPEMVEIQKQKMISTGYLRLIPESFDKLARFMAYREAGMNRKGLVLWGDNGTGKTRWANHFARAKCRAAQEIVVSWRQHGSESALSFVSPCREYGAHLNHPGGDVLIDDLGAEHTLNDFGNKIEALADVIVDRYCWFSREMGKTYITTNLSPEQITKRYDDRIISRLYEMCTFIEFKGSDVRINSEF
jgi:hypothetical protein